MATSSDIPSMHETYMRQNVSCSLVNINETAANVFHVLDEERRQKETMDTFHLKGNTTLQTVTNDLLNSETLISKWASLFPEGVPEDVITSVFSNIVNRFMLVANNQYRKTILASVGSDKKKAHRTEIEIGRQEMPTKSNNEGPHSYEDFIDDTTENKQMSHHYWKAQLMKKTRLF